MNGKLSLKLIITESFLPFILLLLLLFFFLNYIDSIIDSYSEKAVLIRLDTGSAEVEKESSPAVVKLEAGRYPEKDAGKVAGINSYLKKGYYSRVISLIEKEPAEFKNRSDSSIALAFSYYKVGETGRSLGILNGISVRTNPVLDFYYGLVYSTDEKSYEKAIGSYKKYLDHNPLSYEGNSNLGLLLYKNEKYREAAGYFMPAAENSSGNRRSTALYRLSLCRIKLKEREKAMVNLNESIRLNPSNLKARRKLAGMLYEKNRKRGIKEYRKIVALDRGYSYGYYIIGKYLFDADKPVRALRTLREGLAVSVNAEILKSYLGFIYLSLGEYRNSEEVYRSLVSEYPGNKLYHFNLARSFFGLNNYRKSVEEYKKALKIDSGYYKAVVNLGVTYSKMHDFNNSVKYYNIAIKQKPGSPLLYYNLGVLYNKHGSFGRAESYFLKAIDLDRGYAEAYFNIGYISIKRGNNRRAVEYYKKAIAARGSYVLPYVNLSILYRNSGRAKEAIDVLNRGISATGSLRLSGILGNLYFREKRYDTALGIFQGILKTHRNNTDALLGMARVFYRKKGYSEARRYLKRYIFFKPKDVEGRYLMMLTLFRLKDFRASLENLMIVEKLKPSYGHTKKYRERIMKEKDISRKK